MIPILFVTGYRTKYQDYLISSLITNLSIPKCDIIISDYTFQPANVTVVFGEHILALLCKENINNIRGTVFIGSKGEKIIPTISLEELTKDLGLEIIVRADLLKAKKERFTPDYITPNWHIKTYPTFQEAVTYLDFLLTQEMIAFDIETSLYNQQILCLGLACSPTEGISIPFSDEKKNFWQIEEEVTLWIKISELLNNKKIKKVAHNACFDVASLLHNNRIWVENFYFDTMLAWHVLYLPSGSGTGLKKDLGFVASMMLNVPAWKHKSKENLAIYNVKDACITWALVEPLKEDLIKKNLLSIFNMEMSEIEPAIYMSLKGFKISHTEQEKINSEINTTLCSIKNSMKSILKKEYNIIEEINYNSPKQLQKLLYVDLKLPVQLKRGNNKISTDEESLEKLSIITNNPLLNLLLKYRELFKLKSYCDIKTCNDKVYTSFNIAGTGSGRWSSSENIILPYGSGNLQNIPSRGYGSIIRKMYSVDNPNNWIIQGDYIQAEAVIIAYLIDDQILKAGFKTGKDIHKLTASMMFNLPEDKISHEQREIGKVIRHATNYSLGYQGLAKLLKCNNKIAKKHLETFHEICPQLKRWHLTIQDKLKTTRCLINPFGRKKVFYGRFDDSMYRSGYSYIPQSTIGDLLNISLVDFYTKYGNEYDILIQLHDAMYIDDVPEIKIIDCISKLKECMVKEIDINGEKIIINVDFKKGKNWKEMEKIK